MKPFQWNLEKLISGNERYLASLISRLQDDPDSCYEFLPEIYIRGESARKAGARIFGITGPPGAGKSSLLSHLLKKLDQESVGVLLIDPSSPFSGGALLGDRLRLQSDIPQGHFVRSLGTRGQHGGLCRAARDLVRVLLASGKKYVFVETVGVGQTETEIMELADVTNLVLTPESGDVIQTLKAGVMEIADVFIINKSDRPGSQILKADLHALDPNVSIIETMGTTGKGIEELWKTLQNYPITPPEELVYRRALADEICQNLRWKISEQIHHFLLEHPKGRALISQVMEGKVDPYSVTQGILKDHWK